MLNIIGAYIGQFLADRDARTRHEAALRKTMEQVRAVEDEVRALWWRR